MSQHTTYNNIVYREHKYVISACGFTFQGYHHLLQDKGGTASRILFDGDEVASDSVEKVILNQYDEICVFLGRELVTLLATLKKLASLLNALPTSRTVILYGRLPESWLYRTLENLVGNKNKLSGVRVVNIAALINAINDTNVSDFQGSRLLHEASLYCSHKNQLKGLTEREFIILLNFYRGMSVKEQCEKLGLSNKTVYTHRKEGMRKLHLLRPWLEDRNALTMEMVSKRNTSQNPLSPQEMEIYTALLRKEIFPAYQIITDNNKKVMGFEILLRWNKNGKIIRSANFLADVVNIEIWLKITAMVIHAAISGINRYNGKYYFSVNIPPPLASGNALPGMAKKAVEMLLNPQWAEKLVFEFAETIDVTKDKTIPETMQRLRNTGCKLFLDDCFSNHQVMFPVRQVHFDGLKLDRDIVEHFVANDGDYNLIKAIQFYSDISGNECVAEGVDSEEKFEKLVALGVKSFQGYFLSRAVKEDELDRMVRMFS